MKTAIALALALFVAGVMAQAEGTTPPAGTPAPEVKAETKPEAKAEVKAPAHKLAKTGKHAKKATK